MGTRALGRLANSSHWNRSLASALLGSRESSFRSGKSLSSSYPVLGSVFRPRFQFPAFWLCVNGFVSLGLEMEKCPCGS